MGWTAGQEDVWGAKAHHWAAHQEPQFLPLYQHAFAATGVEAGVRLLDAGCGAGLAVSTAIARGATASGFDPSQALLDIARQRAPEADLRLGAIEHPPHEPGSFDVITMFNVAHHAGDDGEGLFGPLHAQGRVGARLAITTWGDPARCDMWELLAAVGAWSPTSPEEGPFGLSSPGRLERLVSAGGFSHVYAEEASCPFLYPDMDAALAGLLSAAPFVVAARQVGEGFVREAVASVLLRYRDPAGGVRLENVFRCVLATV